MPRYTLLRFTLFFLSITLCQNAQSADELPQHIDALITAAAGDTIVALTCTDETFVRRIYLDLAGRIPTYDEALTFLASPDPNKRTLLVDQLLASPEFPVRMRDLLHVLLMERRGDNPEWTKFLQAACESNRPWDQLVREILDPVTDDESRRGAAFFHTRRLEKVGQQDTDYPGLTRDVGRLFLGMDLQCAQCHDHLFVESYKQPDFQGLYVVYKNTVIRADVKFPAIGEKVMDKKGEFSSVFEKVSLTTGPRVPGRREVDIPVFEKGQEYQVPPDRKANFGGTPKFRGMQVIAQELPIADNHAFRANIANRLWFLLMGRGLVHPLDFHHAGNPPSHPELFELLGNEVVAQKFDLKAMLRHLVLTQTYQRTSELNEGSPLPPPEKFVLANERRMSAEQILNSVRIATGPRSIYPQQRPEGSNPAPEAKNESDESGTTSEPIDKVRAAFVKAFGNVPQDPEVEFSPSLKSSLFALNDPLMLDFLSPKQGNLVGRLLACDDHSSLADELYLSVLTRKPTDEERAETTEYLGKFPDRRQMAIQNLAWALLASTEFCLNH